MQRQIGWKLRAAAAGWMPGRISSVALVAVVVGWWLMLGATVSMLIPNPAASASPGPRPVVAGATGRFLQPGFVTSPVPTSRRAFDLALRGFAESDESLIDAAFAEAPWLNVEHLTALRIVAIDGDAVEIVLLDGPHVGRHGWVKPRHLGP